MTNPKKLMRGVCVALALVLAAPLGGISLPIVGVSVAQAQQARLISAVLFEGNTGINDGELSNLINTASTGTYTAASIAADAEAIRQALIARGYVNATVTTRVEAVTSDRDRIIFIINEGERTGIAAINFAGNNSIGSGTLKSVIRTRETGLLSWLFRDDSFSEDMLQVDSQLIELYYMNNGYPDVQVTSAVGEFDASRNAYFVSFTISEGERYRFGEVGVETSIAGLNADALASVIRSGRGGTYSLADVERSQQDLAFEAAAQGFAFADVRPRIDRDIATGTFNITYLVDEGARVYIERINITGNTKTRDAIIRRELDFGEGDPFNRSMVQRAKTNVEGLGFFKVVTFDVRPGSASDKVILDVAVQEQPTGEYGATAGYDTSAGILGELSISERNFLGRGQYVRASLTASGSGKGFDFSFTEPRFAGLRVSAGFDVYHRIADETDNAVYGTTATGGQVRLGAPITTDLSSSIFVGIEQKTILDEESPYSDIVANGEVYDKAWIGYSLNYNTLDDSKKPTEGFLASFTQQYIGWDYNLLKTELKGRYFQSLNDDWGLIGSVKGQAGYITALDDGGVFPLETFRAGNVVRGFQSGSIGPRLTSTGESLGYTGYVGLSAELDFPLPMIPETYGLRGAIWADAGYFEGNGSTDTLPSLSDPIEPGSIDENFKSSVGASIIWDSPFGPLRGDFAHVINKATDDKTQVFTLTIQQLL